MHEVSRVQGEAFGGTGRLEERGSESCECDRNAIAPLHTPADTHERLSCLCPTPDGRLLLSAGTSGLVNLRWLHSLQVTCPLRPTSSPHLPCWQHLILP